MSALVHKLQIFVFLVTVSVGETVTCPALLCDITETSNLFGAIDTCYSHDKETPTKTMNAYKCDLHQFAGYTEFNEDQPLFCDFNLMDGKFAWFDDENPNSSQLLKKRTESYCRPVDSVNQNLNAGRTCQNSWQCQLETC